MRDWCKAQGHPIAGEYVEAGASATDDRRPVFQQMMADARLTPCPFEVIVVYSLFRFFRDAISFGVYERQLTKRGVKIISITQQTAEDSSGQMARRMFSIFDEYQSQENAKHFICRAEAVLESAKDRKRRLGLC